MAGEQRSPAVGFEGAAVIDAMGINRADEFVLYAGPCARSNSNDSTSIGMPLCSMAAAAAM